jgi:DnaJ-class molecular chaperone
VGDIDVSVPPGTQPDEVIRIRGKGLPEFGGGARGDLNLRIHVHIPEDVSADERALYEQLRALRGNVNQKNTGGKSPGLERSIRDPSVAPRGRPLARDPYTAGADVVY